MSSLSAEPDFGRREVIEAHAHALLDRAADEVARAWSTIAGRGGAPPSDLLEGAARDVLRVVLAHFVQGGIDVADRERLEDRLRAGSTDLDVREWLRTVRLAGVEAVLGGLQFDPGLTRTEEARLRDSAQRIESLIGGSGPDLLPGPTDTLRRLQSTGADVR